MNLICKSICIAAMLNAMAWKCPAQATLPSDFSVPQPAIPDRTFKITDFGAKADGKTFDTKAFQSAIAACKKAGGGTVDVPPGQYLVTPFVLASNLNLHLESGAVIRLSPDPNDYNLVDGQYESAITLKNGHDIAITGAGAIDGQGARFWKEFVPPKTADPMIWQWIPRRPRLIQLTRCTNVLIEGVTLTNSPMFHLVPAQCKNVTIRGIHIKAPAHSPNTDGIDPSGQNYLIENCTIDTGDDCIAVKAGGALGTSHLSCENFLIQNCTFLHGHGMSIGSETSGGLRNMLVRNCTFDGTDAGIRIKSSRDRGGPVENVTYENLTMHNVKDSILITSYYPKIPTNPVQDHAHAVNRRTPSVSHIRITDLTSTDSLIAGQIVGLPEMPLQDIILTRVRVSAQMPMQIFHANGVQFIDCRIFSTAGAPIIIDSTVQGLADLSPEGNRKPTMNRQCCFALIVCGLFSLTGCQSAPAPDPSPPAPAQPVISAPDIPARSFTITDFGAAGDGKTDNTDAIAKTIAACSAAGGGHVVIPMGNFYTRPIRLDSQIDLHLDAGATLIFSRKFADFPLVLSSYEGQQTYICASPIMGDNLHDVEISGQGAIDGQGDAWRMVKKSKLTPEQWKTLVASGGYVDARSSTWYPVPNATRRARALTQLRASLQTPRMQDYQPFHDMLRPPLVVLSNSHNVLLDGVTFRNSAAWNIHLLLTDDVTVHAVTIFNPYYAQNGDGIDIDSCRHVLVEDSTINAGDDVICLKSGRNEEGRRMHRPTEDVTVENCILGHGHGGIAIGSETSGDVRDIHVHDCILNGTDDAIRIKSTRGRGGIVENIDIHNLEMWNITNSCISLDMYYMVKKPTARNAPPPDFDAPPPPDAPVAKPLVVTQEAPQPLGPGTPLFRNINIRNILCHGANTAIQIHGLPEMPLQTVTIENADITAKQGGAIVDADGTTLRNVVIRASAVPDLQFQHATNITLENVDAVPQVLPRMVIPPPQAVGLANQ